MSAVVEILYHRIESALRLSAWCGLLLASAAPALCAAQNYPVKPVRMIVPYAAGGGVDIMGRLMASKLSAETGQQFVIDNRGGAGGILGTDLAAKAPADGYTLLFTNPAHVANPSLNAKLPYDTLRDFVAVSLAGVSSSVLVVYPATPAKTVKELVALARAKPGQIGCASAGTGSAIFLAMALFQSIANIDIIHIPYKGAGPAMTDVIGGQVPMMFIASPPALPHIKAGRLRALGTSSAKGLSVLPEVPPIAATYPGFDHTDWYGIVAPAGTPAAVIAHINQGINQAMAMPDVRERIQATGATAAAGTPQEFETRLRNEALKWAKVFKKP